MVHLDNLFKRISELGLSARNVAKATGISSGNISDWKMGRALPTATKLDVLADYLDCSVDYLLGRTDISNMPNRIDENINVSEMKANIEKEQAIKLIDTVIQKTSADLGLNPNEILTILKDKYGNIDN
jgi:transcriptional regulator with XRE-family HTH domain